MLFPILFFPPKANISIVHTPIQVDRSLYEEHKKSTHRIVAALLRLVDVHLLAFPSSPPAPLPSVPLLLKETRYNKMLHSLATHMQFSHIVQFTNVEQSGKRSALLSGLTFFFGHILLTFC